MATVTATIKVTFNVDYTDDESIREKLYDVVETKIAEDYLFENTKIKVKVKEDEEDENEFDEEDEE